MLASEVMNDSAAFLNDRARSMFTYTVQIPYLNVALSELREIMEQNNVPMTNESAVGIILTAGLTGIGGPNENPALPPDLIEPQELFERSSGTTQDFIPMVRKDFLPNRETLTASLVYWSWQDQMIKFLGATGDREIKINYVANAVPRIVTENDPISVINARTFLSYRTAGLCARFIGENESRSQELTGNAQVGMDRFLSISTKGRQSIFTRRRPFMASYKVRGGY